MMVEGGGQLEPVLFSAIETECLNRTITRLRKVYLSWKITRKVLFRETQKSGYSLILAIGMCRPKGYGFCMESGKVFDETVGAYERIYFFNSKWIRKKEKYANWKAILFRSLITSLYHFPNKWKFDLEWKGFKHKTAFLARTVTGTFEKRVPGYQNSLYDTMNANTLKFP